MSGLHPAYALRQRVVEPIGERARPSWQIWKRTANGWDWGGTIPWQDMQTRQLYPVERRPCLSEGTATKGISNGAFRCYYANQKCVRRSLRRVAGAIATDIDNTYGEQLRFKSPIRQNRTLFRNHRRNCSGYGVPRVRVCAEKNELYFIRGKVAVHTNGATQYVRFTQRANVG